ncbi:MAG: CoA pyrophosphatase [Geobacter sp.]|nr:CoA pyrophosphatase [Geobacter sp.]
MATDLLERIRNVLAGRERIPLPPGPVPAAVLVPLFLKDGEYHLLFTKRTAQLNHHGGEISFPGGVCNPEEDLQHAALRETWEEVGIRPEQVEVLGQLDDFYSVHNYLVTPYVGFVSPFLSLKLNMAEIDKVLEVPVRHLLDPKCFRIEDWNWKGRLHPVYFYGFGEDEIWGLTAAILKQFLDLIFSAGNMIHAHQHSDH